MPSGESILVICGKCGQKAQLAGDVADMEQRRTVTFFQCETCGSVTSESKSIEQPKD